MAYSYEQLRKMTVVQLREIATGIESEELKGMSIMHKEKLLPLLCRSLGVTIPHHHVEGMDKTAVKQEIRKLKVDREEALRQKDRKSLKTIMRRIHDLKRELRKHMV